MLAKVALHPHVDGHAPGVLGRALDAYAATGIASDHEATTWEEALEKRRRGIWVLLREASNARNLVDLLELVRRYGPEYCAFCTDDREPDMLLREGHIDAMCRTAVAEGIAPEDVLVMASLHGARCHGLADLGAIAPGYRADMVVLDDLERFARRARDRRRRGSRRATASRCPFAAPEVPGWVRDTRAHRAARRRRRSTSAPAAGGDVRMMGIVPGQLITTEAHEPPPVAGGRVVADPARDLAKLAVVERHHATGRVGAGLVRGFGLRRGAFASTVAHDAHNIVVVGADDASMARVRASGWRSWAAGSRSPTAGAVRGELALPGRGAALGRAGRGGRRAAGRARRAAAPSRACGSRRRS